MSAALPIEVIDHYQDKRWRLSNLYYIINERGERVKFVPNWVQQDLLDEMWYLNLVIKSRQLGVTTLADLWLLDDSLFNANVSGAIIADNERKATEIFREKIRFPYDNLPLGLRRARYLETDQSHTLVFDNKSRVTVGVSVRGLTFQNLHVSELVYVCDETRDVQAARKAGLRSIAVTWGFNSRKALEKAGPDFIIDQPDELLGIITKH